MARQKGLIKLQGTIGGLTFVNSKAYKPHSRLARGTHKEAVINKVFQRNVRRSKPVTRFGSPVLRELKNMERGFAQKDLWQEMLSRMFRAASHKTEDLLGSLVGLELNEAYGFAGLFSTSPELVFYLRKKRLLAHIELSSPAFFPKVLKANNYLLDVAVLFSDGKGNWIKECMETEWISIKEESCGFEMEFEKPAWASYFLVVAGVKGGRDEKEIQRLAARGIKVWGWGRC